MDMRTRQSSGGTSPRDYAKALEKRVRPNVYGVLRLKNGTTGTFGQKAWVQDPETHFDGVALQYVTKVTKALVGETAFRRSGGRLLPNFVTLEGDGQMVRYHLNLLIQRPDWVSFEEFRGVCQFQWMKAGWSIDGKTAFWMEELSGGASSYSFKDGIDVLLHRSATEAGGKPSR
jgi:hypothetical protein